MNQKDFSEILRRVPRRIEVGRAAFHLLTDSALLAAAAGAVRAGRFGWIAGGSILAAFLFRAFGMMHECVHSACHKNKRTNDLFGQLYGIFCFLPFSSWRTLHLEHHFWTGNVEKDPSMRILYNFKNAGFKVSRLVDFCWRYWIPLLGLMQHMVFWRATLSRREYAFIAGVAIYLVTAAFVFGPGALATGILIYLYMVEIINFPHHLSLVQFEGDTRIPVHNQETFARSCLYPRWFARNVLLNFNLHTEHHLFPAHPWYQLEDLHRELVSSGGTFQFVRGNEWILENRSRSPAEVFKETFAHPNQGEEGVA